MRIAIGQLWQETNTLNPLPTRRENFNQFGVIHGAALVEQMATTNELGGFIQRLRSWPEMPEIVGLVRLPAWPSGAATPETFDWILTEMVSAIRAAGRLDGVLLALHGAMSAVDHPDVEGEVLAAVRAALDETPGPHVPLVATLDLHANVTRKMVQSADALVLFHTVPHVDVYETGERGAAVLRRILVDGFRPITAFQKIPCVLPAEKANTQLPTGLSSELRRACQALEARPEFLTAGIATVQPWLDIPEFGSAVLVTTDRRLDVTGQLAAQTAAQLADTLWQRRTEYLPELVSMAEAVERAHANPTGLTVLSDAADATTSGAPGDSVWLLQELLTRSWDRPVLVTLVAPAVVQRAQQIGVGQTMTTALGGVRDTQFGTTLELTVEVERLLDARFVLNGHLGKNLPIDMGPTAVLRHDQVRIIVTTMSGPHFAPELFQTAGFDPFAAAVVVAKSPCGFRAVYADRAAQIFSVRAPGCAPSDFWNYRFEQIPRPLWPWDEITEWQSAPECFFPNF
ncbi:MAG: M81 family metallopeptidase [Planctomycetota bacterium]